MFNIVSLINICFCILLTFDSIHSPPKIPVDLYLFMLLELIINISYVISILIYYFFLPIFITPSLDMLTGIEKFPTVMDRTEIFSFKVSKQPMKIKGDL